MIAISVVIAAYNAEHTIHRCLASLTDQTAAPREIIVVSSGADAIADLIAADFPTVQLIRSPKRLYPGDARNLGCRAASGDVFAFIDADCVAAETWVERIALAHRNPAPLIGGAVGVANPGSRIGWAAWFYEFSQWMPGTAAGLMAEIPTCCLSIKRWAFERFGPFLEGSYCSDSVFNWRAAAAGDPPVFHPDIQVAHTNIEGLRKLWRKALMHGETFAHVRVREQKFSFVRRLLYCAGSPVLPAVLLIRIIARVHRNGRYWNQFLRAIPVLVTVLAMWSLGEWKGYSASPEEQD